MDNYYKIYQESIKNALNDVLPIIDYYVEQWVVPSFLKCVSSNNLTEDQKKLLASHFIVECGVTFLTKLREIENIIKK